MSWIYKNCKHVLDVPSPERPCPMSRPITTLLAVIPGPKEPKLYEINHYISNYKSVKSVMGWILYKNV